MISDEFGVRVVDISLPVAPVSPVTGVFGGVIGLLMSGWGDDYSLVDISYFPQLMMHFDVVTYCKVVSFSQRL